MNNYDELAGIIMYTYYQLIYSSYIRHDLVQRTTCVIQLILALICRSFKPSRRKAGRDWVAHAIGVDTDDGGKCYINS